MPDYIPRSDIGCLEWSRNFAARVTASPQRYGLTESDAVVLMQVQGEYATALRLALEPATRTRPIIIAKDDARAAMLKVARQLANQARAALTDPEAKLTLGLGRGKGRSARRTKIGVPNSAPTVWIREVVTSCVSIRLHDPTAPTRRGKGPGMMGANVFSFVGDAPPPALAQWRFHAMTSRTDVKLEFGCSYPPGTIVWICAQWMNAKGQAGPAGPARHARLAYAGMRLKAA